MFLRMRAYLALIKSVSNVVLRRMCAGPPGVYSPDVAGLYMGEQHMMRAPGKMKAALPVNDSVDIFSFHRCFFVTARVH